MSLLALLPHEKSHLHQSLLVTQTGIPGSAWSSQWMSLPGSGAGFPSGRSWMEARVTQGVCDTRSRLSPGLEPLMGSRPGRKLPLPGKRISERGNTQKPDESWVALLLLWGAGYCSCGLLGPLLFVLGCLLPLFWHTCGYVNICSQVPVVWLYLFLKRSLRFSEGKFSSSHFLITVSIQLKYVFRKTYCNILYQFLRFSTHFNCEYKLPVKWLMLLFFYKHSLNCVSNMSLWKSKRRK